MPPTRRPHQVEVIARGLLRIGQRILLCRNIKKGYYYLPGGHVEPGEPAADALRREFREETGFAVRPGPVLLVAEILFGPPRDRRHEINIVFHVEQLPARGRRARAIRSREPGIAFEWVDHAAIVGMDLRPAAIRAWIAAGTVDRGWISTDETA